MTDRAAELERLKSQQRVKRYRDRKAGFLPPLPVCPKCGAKILTDRWLPLCSICGRNTSGERRGSRGQLHKARPVRLAAEEIIRELRAEARGHV
jgi:ribosomal protein L32